MAERRINVLLCAVGELSVSWRPSPSLDSRAGVGKMSGDSMTIMGELGRLSNLKRYRGRARLILQAVARSVDLMTSSISTVDALVEPDMGAL